MARETSSKDKLRKMMDYTVDNANVAHIYLMNGVELARLQLFKGVGVLVNTELVEDVMETYYESITKRMRQS